MSKKRALGKGLSELLNENDRNYEEKKNKVFIKKINSLEIDLIKNNPFQPRSNFNIEKINELASSIDKYGIIQPITVKKIKNGFYELISGERRLKASQMAGLKKIPAFIKIANDQQMLEMALVENIQRENLNPIEIALSYQRLIEEIDLTQEQCSERVGKNRSTVTNFLRLLKLPNIIQKGLINNTISNGHAKSLLSINSEDSQINLYHDIVANGYSVREVEQLAKEFSDRKYKKSAQQNV